MFRTDAHVVSPSCQLSPRPAFRVMVARFISYSDRII